MAILLLEDQKSFSIRRCKLQGLKHGKFAFRGNQDWIRKKGGRTQLNARGSTQKFIRLIDQE